MKKNALAIGVGYYEYINILLSYYPKNLNEDFDIFIFADTSRVDLNLLKDLVNSYNIPVWSNATYIELSELYDLYTKELNLKGKANDILYNHGCMFKVLQPIYLTSKYDYEKVLSSDDDVFIFRDLSDIFCKYKEFAFKKETIFTIKSSKEKTLKCYNEIFGTNFSLERINSLPLNAGNILSVKDEKLIGYFYDFLNHETVHDLFYNYKRKGFTSWTIEQRFQHFNMHRLLDEGRSVEFLQAEDVRLLLTVGKNHPEKHLQQKVPRLFHYAIGKRKTLFLREFLPRIEWKYGFIYETKYELKNKIFIENKLF